MEGKDDINSNSETIEDEILELSHIVTSPLENEDEVEVEAESDSEPDVPQDTDEDEGIPVVDLDVAEAYQDQFEQPDDFSTDEVADVFRQENIMENINFKLDDVKDQVKHLALEFQSKLKYDSHKQKMIDTLHHELQEYKNDILKKSSLVIVMDLIKFIGNMRKLIDYYHAQDPDEHDPVKLLNILKNVPLDLEDIFYTHGIDTFSSDNNCFDAARQKIIKKEFTSDKDKDKTIARSLRPGYKWDDKVIQAEMVAVYVYKKDI